MSFTLRKNTRWFWSLVAFSIVLAGHRVASAAHIAWSNAGTGNWTTGGNWTGGNPPAPGDTADFDNDGTAIINSALATSKGFWLAANSGGARRAILTCKRAVRGRATSARITWGCEAARIPVL